MIRGGRAQERGSALLDLGRPSEALVHLRDAVSEDPDDAFLHCLIAVAQLKLGKPTQALEAANAGAALDPEDAWPPRLMAIAFGELGKKRKARAAAVEACRLDPYEPMAHEVLSGALQATGDEAGALAAARHAVELDPASPDAHNQVGLILLAHERLPEAADAFSQALELDAEHSEALNNRAVALLGMGRRDESLKVLAGAARLDPRSETIRENVLLIGAARMKRRVALFFAVAGASVLASGRQVGSGVFGLGLAALLELLRWKSLRDLDEPTRALIKDDGRSRRFHPLRWEWRWLTELRPWWWLLIREVAKRTPASLVLGVNVGLLALAAAHRDVPWVVIMGLGMPFSAWRFHRLWRRKHPGRRSWRPHDRRRVP